MQFTTRPFTDRGFRRLTVALSACGVALAVACTPPEQANAFIQGVIPLDDECGAQAGGDTFQSTSLLDIGKGADSANSLSVALQVLTNLPATFSSSSISLAGPNFPNYGPVDNNIISFTESEVFFTTEADSDTASALVNEGTPVNDASAARASVSGVLFNEQSSLLNSAAILATPINKRDAALLQGETFIADALGAANVNGTDQNRVRVVANIRIGGNTSGGATVRTPPFPYPVDLCQGCLLPTCANGEAIPPAGRVCFPGADHQAFSCP